MALASGRKEYMDWYIGRDNLGVLQNNPYSSACSLWQSLRYLWWCICGHVHPLGWKIEKINSDKYDIIDNIICLIGAFVIMYWPRNH